MEAFGAYASLRWPKLPSRHEGGQGQEVRDSSRLPKAGYEVRMSHN